jgi:carbonic anhydrase
MSNFATVVNCMDGRIQEAVNKYIIERRSVKYVDTITEAGPCKIITDNIKRTIIDNIKFRLDISISKHNSNYIAVVGHHDCAAVEECDSNQKKYIINSAKIISEWYPNIPVEAFWVNEQFEVVNLI